MATHDLPRRGVDAPSRRDLFGAAGFTALAGIAAVTLSMPEASAARNGISSGDTPNPDAELIGFGQEAATLLPAIERDRAAFFATPKPSVPTLNMLADRMADPEDRMEAMAERAMEITAVSPAGITAKARLLRYHLVNEHCLHGQYAPGMAVEIDLALSLCEDLLRGPL